jgi:hypothetical protein
VKEDPLPEPFTISAYITDAHAEMTHYVRCPMCHGRIGFNLEELEARRRAGQNTSLRCWGLQGPPSRNAPGEHWHPNSPWEAGPIYEFEWRKVDVPPPPPPAHDDQRPGPTA